MASNSLYIMLCSGEHEKVQMAAMMASVGAGLFAMLAMLSKPGAQRSLAFLLAFGEKLQRGVSGA